MEAPNIEEKRQDIIFSIQYNGAPKLRVTIGLKKLRWDSHVVIDSVPLGLGEC